MTARRISVAIAVTAAIGAIMIVAGLLSHGWVGNIALIGVVGALSAVVVWTVVDLEPSLAATTWFPAYRDETLVAGGLDHRLTRLRRAVRDTTERSDRSDALHETITELTAERLHRRHGLALDTHEGREALPQPLLDYLDQDPTTGGKRSARTLETIIRHVEEL